MELHCSVHPFYHFSVGTDELIRRDHILNIPCLLLLVELVHTGKDAPQGLDHLLQSRGDLILIIHTRDFHADIALCNLIEGTYHDILEVLGKPIHLARHYADLIGPVHVEAHTKVALAHLSYHLSGLAERIPDGPGSVEGNSNAYQHYEKPQNATYGAGCSISSSGLLVPGNALLVLKLGQFISCFNNLNIQGF
ncbi:MAG: hypothetical protein A4E65_00382 [Syntrophorhabdus sp. PtaU1.Bin153]|nr:MAG: hypothetical protein A4E65_00382 [Syntrophorhabdus sp. PtaU1.Bin153]